MRSLQPEANPTTAPHTVAVRGRGEVREGGHPGPGGHLPDLQRRYGNRRVRSMIQAKLNVGPVDDRYEREADQVALLATGSSAQRAPEAARHVPDAAGGVADSGVSQAVARAGGAGREVPAGVRKRMERVSGADFSDVRVHVNAGADRLNDALGSRAFTVGSDVFVRRSEYRPGSARGDALLAHELAHTVQQGGAPLASSEAASTTVTPVAQRAFGFELELHSVPVFSKRSGEKKEHRFLPVSDKSHSIGKIENGHDIHHDKSDKLSQWTAFAVDWYRAGELDELPIVELVTPPFQESWTRDEVKGAMRPLVTAAGHIRTVMANQGELPVQDLSGVTRSVSPDNLIGFPAAPYKEWNASKTGPPPVDVSAHVQATYGLPLRSVGNVFRKRGERDRTQAPSNTLFTMMMEHSQDDLTDANTIATQCVNAMRSDAAQSKYRKLGLNDSAFEAAHGFFALIANYLFSGSREKMSATKDLGKNRLGLYYYKTSLSTVRNQLARVHPGIGQLLKNNSKKYQEILLPKAKRGDTWSMFATEIKDATGEKKVNSWVAKVLQGNSDFVFTSTKNPWSAELHFSQNTEEVGVVVENRKFAQTENNEYTHEYPPAEWPEMAARVWDFLQDKDG